MSATYFFALTDYGSSVVAQAHNQRNIELFNLVLGDANGQPYSPLDRKSFDTLVNQRASVPVQSVTAIGEICRVISTIDSQIGGFNIHELGLTDATGKLVYVGNYHGGYKVMLYLSFYHSFCNDFHFIRQNLKDGTWSDKIGYFGSMRKLEYPCSFNSNYQYVKTFEIVKPIIRERRK